MTSGSEKTWCHAVGVLVGGDPQSYVGESFGFTGQPFRVVIGTAA